MAMMITSFAALGISVAAEGEYFTITASNRNLFINVNQKIALKDISVVVNDVALSGSDVAWTSTDAAVSIADGNLIVSEKGMFTLNVEDASGNTGTVTVLTKLPEETEYVLYEENFDTIANGTLPEGWTEVTNPDKGTAPAGLEHYVENAQVIDGKLYIGNGINTSYNYVWMPEFLDAFPDTQVSVSMAQTWTYNNIRAGGIVTRGERANVGTHPTGGYRIFIRRATTGGDGMRLTSLARIDNAANKTDKALPFYVGSTRSWSRPDWTVQTDDPYQTSVSEWYTPAESTDPEWKAEGYYVTWDVTTTDDRYTIDAYKSYEQAQFGGDMGPGGGGGWWETYHLKGDPSLEGYEMDVDLSKWEEVDKRESGAIGFYTSGVQLAIDSVKVTVPVSILNANPDKYEFIPDPALATYESQKIGVISDVHLQEGSTAADYALKNALTNMKNDGVSAVLFTGDLVNTGVEAEYEKFNSIWDSVMGDTDIKMLTITGNHEFEGVYFRGEDYDQQIERYLAAFDLEEANFHEVINGIHVIGINSESHLVDGKYTMETTDWLEEELEAAKADNPYGPIIVMCHQTVANTTYGSEWGSSATAELNTLLKDYPQVVYLAGHSHFDFTNEKSIMQKDYTTIDVPSLQYTSTENGEGGSTATCYIYQNYLMLEIDGESKTMSVKRMKSYETDADTHAYETVQVKDAWTLNLPIQKKSQFTYTADRADAVAAPTFAEDAAVEITDVTTSSVSVKFPAASHEDYVHAYNVKVTDASGEVLLQKYFVSDFYMLGEKQAEYALDLAGLPCNTKINVEVTAQESYGKQSAPIVGEASTLPITTPSVGENKADFFDVNMIYGYQDNSGYRRDYEVFNKAHPIKLYDDETLNRQVSHMGGWINYTTSMGSLKEISDAFTMELMFKTPATEGGDVEQRITGTLYGGGITYIYNRETGVLKAGPYIGNYHKYVEYTLTPETWYHTVVTYDGENVVLYVDGVKVGETAATGEVNFKNTYITLGACTNAAGNAAYTYQGDIAVARIYTEVMDRSSVARAINALENDSYIAPLYNKYIALYNVVANNDLNGAHTAAAADLLLEMNLAINSTALTPEIADAYIAEANALLINLMKYDLKAPYVLFEDDMDDFTKIWASSYGDGLQWEYNADLKDSLISRSSPEGEKYVIYKLPGNASEIEVDVHSVTVYDKDYTDENVDLFVSNDGEIWVEVPTTLSSEVNALASYWTDSVLSAKVDGQYNYVKIQVNQFGNAIDENGAEVGQVNWATVLGGIRVYYAEDGVEIPEPNFAKITKEPATAAYAKMSKTAKVAIKAEGDGLTYQWYFKNANGTKYSKSSITSATYTVKMSDKVKGRRVYCVVTDKYGNSVQTKTFILRESVSIVTAPKNAKVAIGKTAKVTVKASGDGLKYVWYVKNAGDSKYTKSKVTSSTYSVKMSKAVNGRRLICYVYDKYGNKVQCDTVKLTKK